MARADFVLVGEQERTFEFSFNGRRVHSREGDTVAVALVREGVHVFSRSMKFHRPRGYYCGSGRCNSCTMRVNGVPGVRTCITKAEPGMIVETQGGFPSTRFDALSVFDSIFRREFDYQHRFIRPRFMTPLYQGIIRRLSSSSRLPDTPAEYPAVIRRSCDVLVVGHGVSGSVAHNKLQGAGVRAMYVLDMRLGSDGLMPPYAFGYYETGEVGSISDRRILLVKPKAVVFATGRAETGTPLVNGDLPGVMLPEALHQLTSRGLKCGERAVIVGKNELRDQAVRELQACGAQIVGEFPDPAKVVRILGRTHVKGIEAEGALVKCDMIVTLGPLVPSVELARQAGCELRSENGCWVVKVDDKGRTSVPGVFACGSVAGFNSSKDRIASAEAAASGVLESIGGG